MVVYAFLSSVTPCLLRPPDPLVFPLAWLQTSFLFPYNCLLFSPSSVLYLSASQSCSPCLVIVICIWVVSYPQTWQVD